QQTHPLLEGSATTASWGGSVSFCGIVVSGLLALSTITSTGAASTPIGGSMAWLFNTGLGQAGFNFFLVWLRVYLRGGNIIGATNASSG
ncbi:hypothetical protein F5148DRAFT_1186729, partial [Russula earlei]